MLHEYGRARVIECESVDDCAEALRLTLNDSDFVSTIHEASMEQMLDV